ADEEHDVFFPISSSPARFDGFMMDKRRAHLFDDDTRQALRRRQSFSISEQVDQDQPEAEREAHYLDEFRWSTLPRLAHLNNVDKHRHLAVTAWWPSLVYWVSNGETNRRL